MKESKGQTGPFLFVVINTVSFATFSYRCDMVANICCINATCKGGHVREITKE